MEFLAICAGALTRRFAQRAAKSILVGVAIVLVGGRACLAGLEGAIVTAKRGYTQRDLDGLARNYGWSDD